jgi:hypothetical protein
MLSKLKKANYSLVAMSAYNSKIALLGGIIDYAGTFAPASLPLPDALKKAATFRKTGKHPWLFSKVALPFTEIKKLTPQALYEAGSDGTPWLYTALAAPYQGTNGNEFLRQVEWDLREIRRWNGRWTTTSLRQQVVSYEVRLTPEVTHKSRAALVHDFLAPAMDRFVDLGGSAIVPFFEVSWDGNWKDGVRSLSEALATWVHEMEDEDLSPGIKVRTGGTHFPNSDQLVEVIEMVARNRLKFKATQGLHHPISRENEWGFVNVFSALTFACALGVDKFTRTDIKRCLESTQASDFTFSSEILKFGPFELPIDEVEAARREHSASFGSCSVDEPDQFLAEVFPS